MPFIGATRQAFLKYCINNSLLPIGFLILYSIVSIRFQHFEEHQTAGHILTLQFGYYLGFFLSIFISFAYFFRVDRDLLKLVIATIANPAHVRGIIPYDSLDLEFDMVRADTYLSETCRLEHIKNLERYHPRLLATVLRRHQRNAIVATLFSLALLLVIGIFMDNPYFRIPAGASFLILFSVLTSIIGAVKYFLKSWEVLGWVLFILLCSFLVRHHFLDLRSRAFGVNYKDQKQQPAYTYNHLREVFTRERYEQDKQTGINTLNNWRARQSDLPPLVVVAISGGGLRAAYWTFHALQSVDSLTHGNLFSHTVMMTGASGGMIGASYWRSVHDHFLDHKISDPYNDTFRQNIGKDILNAIFFSLASVDLISPFNKISVGGYSYAKDRGYEMEQELLANTNGYLDSKVIDYRQKEEAGLLPTIIYNSTVINDGRKMLICAQPVSYLTQPAYSLDNSRNPVIDAIDFSAFFSRQAGESIHTTTALRMSATFPLVLPVVKLPSNPVINIMDAGLRDNFGIETAMRWLFVFRDWLNQNTRQVILLQIRDTREHDVLPSNEQNNLSSMITDPMFVIEEKWEPFQSYAQGYLKDMAPLILNNSLRVITLQYEPQKDRKTAALNFHLTEDERQDIRAAINTGENRSAIDSLVQLLQ